jgi:hypothetical protein
MILRYSALAGALVVSVGSLVTLQLMPTEAFMAAAPSSRAPWTTAGLTVASTTCRRRPSSPLSMGIFEDFLDGQDTSSRAKETEKYLKKLQTRVESINALEAGIEELGDDELTAKSEEFKQRLAAGEEMNGKLLEEAFAVVREASWCVSCLEYFFHLELFVCF